MISKMHPILAAMPDDGLILQVEIYDRLGGAVGIGSILYATEMRGLIEAMQANLIVHPKKASV